jgi:hypothetical protein
MLRALFSLGGIVGGWYGYAGAPLEEEEASEGAGYFLGLARKMPWLAALSVWLAGPVWLATMIGRKFRRKEPEPAKQAVPAPAPPRPATLEFHDAG